jgi:hypothetical protein
MRGLVFAALAVSGFIAAKVPSTSAWTNWVIPIVLIAAAVEFTRAYPDRVRARVQRAG